MQDDFLLGEASKEHIITKHDAPAFSDYAIRVAGVTDITDAYRCARKHQCYHILVMTTAGEGNLATTEGEYRLSSGSLAVVHSLRPFCYQLAVDSWHFLWFILEDDPTWAFLHDLPSLPANPMVAEAIKPLLLLLAEPISRVTKSAITREIYHLLLAALRSPVPVNTLKERLARLFIAVDQQLHSPWTAAELARHLHCSQPTLHRYCQQVYQQTPLQIIIGLRIQRAKLLLRETDWSLDSIAAQLGYSSGLSLSKVFKQKTGLSPMAYRG